LAATVAAGRAFPAAVAELGFFKPRGACNFRDQRTNERNIMQAVIRKYSGKGAVELFNLLEKHAADVQTQMQSVKGLLSYTLARNDSGGFSVTVCQDQAAIDESSRKAKDWITKNASNIGAPPPDVSFGNVVIHV
jgi:hypothetical protein